MDRKLKEGIQHGDISFPVSVYETIVESEFHIPLYYHWHPEMEFFYITSGKANFQIHGEQILLAAGDVIVIKPNILHGSHDCFREHIEFRAVVFACSFVMGVLQDIIQEKYLDGILSVETGSYILIKGDGDKKQNLFQILNTIYEVYIDKREGYELLIKAMLYQAFYYIYPFYMKQAKKTSLDTGRSILMRKVIQYIEDHYQDKITLQEITKELSVSEGYFCRFFKKNFHMTFGDYLMGVRMKEAERRIRETDATLEQIAMDTGFANGNYFTIAFKKIYKESPSSYRKRSRF